jgi:excisionase family DNA binding protein
MYNAAMSETQLWTISEVAERLRLHYMTVYRMIRDGKIAAVQVGQSWRISEAEVLRLLKVPQTEA